MIKYVSKTLRIGGGINNLDSVLDNTLQYIYTENGEENIVSMTITPTVQTREGLRIVVEYWIVYVYKYEENEC